MYKDEAKQREANRLANIEYRKRQKGITEQGITQEGITEDLTKKYPAILLALVDPKKRAMLEYISDDLNRKGLGRNVWYGVGGPDFETVGELLEVTR